MSAKLGSRKARLGLMRLGAPSSTPFLADLPSSLALEGRVTAVALSGDGRTLTPEAGGRSASLAPCVVTAALEDRASALAPEQRGGTLGLADDERMLSLDG